MREMSTKEEWREEDMARAVSKGEEIVNGDG